MVAEDGTLVPSSQSSDLTLDPDISVPFASARQMPKDLLNKIQITLEEKLCKVIDLSPVVLY